MRDVLSQHEIDSLISALSKGQLQAEKTNKEEQEQYQQYDFRRPTKFSKDQLRTLQIIHDNFARILGNFFTAYLRIPVKVKVLSVSQVTYEEFLMSLPIPTLMTIFNMSQELGLAMLETNPVLALTIIDLIFGGAGDTPVEARELTEIELEVMRGINTKVLDNLGFVWKGIATLEPHIETIDTNPQFNQVIGSGETVALVTFSMQIKESEGFVNLCYPYLALEKIIANLTAQYWFSELQRSAKKPQEQARQLDLDDVEVLVSVLLGSSMISLDDLLHIQVGDVLPLQRREGEPLEVLVESERIFLGQPGISEDKYAVLVTDWVADAEREGR